MKINFHAVPFLSQLNQHAKKINMIKEDFPLAVIINWFFHVRKSVKSEHTKCLKDKTLKNTMIADTKKLQKILCIEDVEKVYELTKDKFPKELEYFTSSKNHIGRDFEHID